MSNLDWNKERDQKRLERDLKRAQRVLAAPIARGEVVAGQQRLIDTIASVAVAIEAIETLLVARGILKDDEVMAQIKALLEAKSAQAEAESQVKESSIIAV